MEQNRSNRSGEPEQTTDRIIFSKILFDVKTAHTPTYVGMHLVKSC